MTDRSFSLLLILGVSVSLPTVGNENQSTLTISHKTLWSQNIQRSSDSSSTCSSQLSSSEELENEVEVRPKYKTYGESTWKDVPCEKVEKIPSNVDGLKHYVVKDKSRSSLLAKCKDGRKLKRDSWDLSTPQMLIFIISRNMIKKIVFTLIRKGYVKYVEQNASRNLAIVGSMLHFRATRLTYFMLEFIHAQQKS